MKTWLIIAVITLQVLVLGFMAGQRELILRNGRTVYLRTAPIDPRDPMRGDYVRLTYEATRADRSLWRGDLRGYTNASEIKRDTRIYASLQVRSNGLAEVTSVSDKAPKSGLFLRGRAQQSWNDELSIRYGLEAFFMEQGQGLVLEQGRNQDGIQIPLEMEVAVGSDGTGVLKGHRWSALGIGLSVETREERIDNRMTRMPFAAMVRVLNASSNDVAVLDIPGGRAFRLVPETGWGGSEWKWLNEAQAPASPEASQILVIKPGAIWTNRVAFDDSYWSVIRQNASPQQTGPRKLNELRNEWSARFRLQYRVVEQAVHSNLPHNAILWRGQISSPVFTPAGGSVD